VVDLSDKDVPTADLLDMPVPASRGRPMNAPVQLLAASAEHLFPGCAVCLSGP
jgi:hypothetical protein